MGNNITFKSFLCVLLVVLIAPQCPEAGQASLALIQQALVTLEAWVDRADKHLQRMDIYAEDYSSWYDCNATCGIGFKRRHIIGCSTFARDDCIETLYCNSQPCEVVPQPKKTRHAVCAVRPNEELGALGTVRGVVKFTQDEHGSLVIFVNVTGLPVQSPGADVSLLNHGFHIHQYGDLTEGCRSAGSHFNPKGTTHGGRLSSTRHLGDLGNIQQTPEGDILTTFTDDKATLFGENSIIGRAVWIHRDEDDLGLGGDDGSLATGNAGPPLACCVIGVASGE